MNTIKYLCLFLCAFFFIGSTELNAQNATCDECPACKKQSASTVITKGYYTIGNNAKKLDKFSQTTPCGLAAPGLLTKTDTRQPVSKGFYSIADKHTELATAHTLVVAENNAPKVQKGFYTIGANKGKIDKSKTMALDRCICYNN